MAGTSNSCVDYDDLLFYLRIMLEHMACRYDVLKNFLADVAVDPEKDIKDGDLEYLRAINRKDMQVPGGWKCERDLGEEDRESN